MARIKLTEGELRNIIKKVINESFSKKPINEASGLQTQHMVADLETPDGLAYSVDAILYPYPDGSYEVGDYKLADGSYEEQFKEEIENYILNNETQVEQGIVDQADQNDEYAQSEHDEYNPEEQQY